MLGPSISLAMKGDSVSHRKRRHCSALARSPEAPAVCPAQDHGLGTIPSDKPRPALSGGPPRPTGRGWRFARHGLSRAWASVFYLYNEENNSPHLRESALSS